MTRSRLTLLSTSMLLLSCTAKTEELTEKPIPDTPLHSQIDFGYQEHTGNKDSKSLSFNLQAEYIQGRYRINGQTQFYRSYKNGEEDKRKSKYMLQNDYKIGPKSYLFSSFNGLDSEYGAYFKDYTLSAGYGYQLFDTEIFTFELEAGPGYRYQEPNTDKIDEDDIIFPETVREPIIRTKTSLEWQIIDDLHFLTEMLIVSGESNTLTTTDISLVTDITQNLAAKLTYSRLYHTRVPDNLEKTDTTTSMSIVYRF